MIPADQLENLVLKLHDIGAIRFGQFTLHSGRISPIYIDLRLLVSFPETLRQVASMYRHLLEPLTFDMLAATPLAGLPIATAISLDLNLPLVYPRQTSKGHGTGKQIEGKWQVGQQVVVVDDLITSGDSLLNGIAFLKAAGLRVIGAVVLIDRGQGGRDNLAQEGYALYSALTMDQLLSVLENKGRITAQERANVLRALR